MERLDIDDHVFKTEGSWFPYPDSEPTAITQFGKYANLQYDLHEIGAQVSSLLFDSNSHGYGQYDRLNDLDQSLQSFSQNLPSFEEGGALNPHTMELKQAYTFCLAYHWFRISLFNFANMPNSPVLAPTRDKTLQRHARHERLKSGLEIANLYKRYYREFSPKRVATWMPLTAVTAAYVLLEDLDDPNVQDLYYDVCKVITSVSQRWFCMRGHARMLLATAEQKGHAMPSNAKQLLKKVAVDNWKADDYKHFEGSVFPNYALAKGEDPRTVGMGDLLEKWKNLNLDNLEEKSSQGRTRLSDLRSSSSTRTGSEDSSDMELDRSVLSERLLS
ncbi:hypothetical protein PMZ80_010361 [Knufia obscura]|uniref:Uncharacterized protein n=1 Tax=Knufia obscura TaxID=1635080 RepID=A0ABR0RAY7_9EURO|nr:hypothetical protein PMZ80_010361 [Knufia obscura]